MSTTYPIGYGTQRVTIEELDRRYGPNASIPAHPGYWPRLRAWLISRNGQMGIGGAYRYTQPVKPGFAPPGKSFHEKQTYNSGRQCYAAVDLVATNSGGKHRSPTWAEVPKQASGHPDILKFGVHCNVSGEPWHMQAIEMDGYTTWLNKGRPDPALSFPLPGDPPPPPKPPTGGGGGGGFPPVDLENGVYGLFPLDKNKPTIKKGSTDDSSGGKVSYLQAVLRNNCGLTCSIDGHFGSDTESKVKQMQGWNNLTQDGICGPQTWAVVDIYAGR